jgi:serine/threonine-protein kinase RsbW
MMATATPIRAQMLGRLQHRNVALRSVSAACKLVAKGEKGTKTPVWNEFHLQVISAVSEAFNNIVLHGYEGRDDGVIEMEIHTRPDHISVELRDYGSSFDPMTAKEPELDSLPESGLGIFIIKSFMNVRYRAGYPNVLTLSKKLTPQSKQRAAKPRVGES